MKFDHPILFTPLMVKAILDGKKTMTRRFERKTTAWERVDYYKELSSGEFIGVFKNGTKIGPPVVCPKGKTRSILWVREMTSKDRPVVYKADNLDAPWDYHKWAPSIHMAKEYCRLFLEITEIKIERIGAIDQVDVEREGFKRYTDFIDYVSEINIGVVDPEDWTWCIGFKVLSKKEVSERYRAEAIISRTEKIY